MPPHTIGQTPAIWYHRWLRWEQAKAQRAAKAAVEAHGMANVSDGARAIYNELILGLRDGDSQY